MMNLRHIKSFVKREGRLTPAQAKALTTQWPQVGHRTTEGLLDFTRCFGRSAPVILEIGFGMGDSLLQMAIAHPAWNYIGIEVHRPGVGALLHNMVKHKVSNIRLFQEDALLVLEQCIPPNSLSGIQIFFPDPWPKKKHHKRRLIQPTFLALALKALQPHGWLHLATDWEEYAQAMMRTLSDFPHFINPYGKGQFAPRPRTRPETKFERRGKRLGHGTWDLIVIGLK